MVKVKQRMFNRTLREAYLSQQMRGSRKQKQKRKRICIAILLMQKTRSSIGVKQGSIALNGSSSSAIGQIKKIFR